MKKIVFLLLFPMIGFSQTEKLPVKKIDGKSYYEYKVQSGDGWYSIARHFKITYPELRLSNKNSDKLKEGQTIFIPASKVKPADPYFQKNYIDNKPAEKNHSDIKPAGNGSVTTHKVAPGETLFGISKKYDIPVDEIKRLNKLKSNSISKGQVLTIKSNPTEKKETVQKETKAVTNATPIIPVQKDSPVIKNNEPVEKKEEAENVPVHTNPITAENKEVHENIPARPGDSSSKDEIVFAKDRQQVNETGEASWIDDEEINPNKYYALHRSAPVGTVIKITNRMNNRAIFVKVVGRLPDTGDNDGLIIKVSKASAEKLGVLDQHFQAELLYGMNPSK